MYDPSGDRMNVFCLVHYMTEANVSYIVSKKERKKRRKKEQKVSRVLFQIKERNTIASVDSNVESENAVQARLAAAQLAAIFDIYHTTKQLIYMLFN